MKPPENPGRFIQLFRLTWISAPDQYQEVQPRRALTERPHRSPTGKPYAYQLPRALQTRALRAVAYSES